MTVQIPESIIFLGERLSLLSHPNLPIGHPRLIEEEACVNSSALSRGYQGLWEIKDDRLYLLEVSGLYKLMGKEPLFAEWFTATLRIPQGEMLMQGDMAFPGFGSVYENELQVLVEDGMVIRSELVSGIDAATQKIKAITTWLKDLE